MENPIFLLFFLPFIVSLAVGLITTPFIIKLAWFLGYVDDPRKKKKTNTTHLYPVPRAGGLVILISLLVSSLLFIPFDKHLAGILAGGLIAVLVGFLDDRYDLSPYFRLLTCFLAAGAVVLGGIGIAFISNPFGGVLDLSQLRLTFSFLGEDHSLWLLSSIFALFWIAWCMNFVGWSGGVEGQLPGFVAIAALTIGILSFRFSADITQWPVIILAAITAGAYLGFLPYNFYPQKIMPGYSGKSLAGFLLGVLSLLVTAKVGTLMVVLGLPLVDSFFALLRRLTSKRSPVWGDRAHLHHRLLDMGWSKRKIAVFYWSITAFLGVLALNLNSQQKFYTMITLILIIGGFLLWVSYFTKSSSPPDQHSG